MRFVIDLVKSVAAAERNGKWYQKTLDAGGRWITVKEGPLEGRHILLDKSGYIVGGGKGVPKKVIDHLNGGHVDFTFGNYSYNERHNAVDETHAELGKKTFEDKKGKWSIGHVIRRKYDKDGKHEYDAYIDHEKAAGLKGGNDFGMTGGTFLRHDEGIEELKHRIKAKSGYTPDKETLDKLMKHINKLKDAYNEQDSHYRNSDKTAHAEKEKELQEKAIDRALKGEKPGVKGQEWRERNMQEHEKYLTESELKELREAQKHLRGHSQHDYADRLFGDDKGGEHTLGRFNRKVYDAKLADDKKKEAEAKAKKQASEQEKLEKDPAFRKLVAHAVEASKDKRSDTEHELVHRLHGYTTSASDYREKYAKVQDDMKKHGIEGFNGAEHLAQLGKKYLKDGGTLPAVTPNHERQGNKIYYMDRITDGDTKKLAKVLGTKYIHTDKGEQWDKDKVNHHEHAPLLDAKTADEHAENIMRKLHNFGDVVHGHHMTLESAVRKLRHKRKNTGLTSIVTGLMKRQADATNPDEKRGIQQVLDEIRRQNLPEVLKRTYNATSKKDFEQELAELGGAPEHDDPKQVEWKEGRNPYYQPPKPAPAPSPQPEPKPAPKPEGGKGKEKAPKLGFDGGHTMHIYGNKDTFKHIKNLKHVHGGKWNSEKTRWEFNHAEDSDAHKTLEEYVRKASDAGDEMRLRMRDDSLEGPAPTPAPAPAPEAPKAPANEGGKKGLVSVGGNSYPHKYLLKTEHGAVWNKAAGEWQVHNVPHGGEAHQKLKDFAAQRGLTVSHEHDEQAPAPAPAPEKPAANERDYSRERIADLVKNMPEHADLARHILKQRYDNPDEVDPPIKEWASKQADKALEHLRSYQLYPNLVDIADRKLAHMRSQGVDKSTIASLGSLHTEAETEHAVAEAERKQKEREKAEEKERAERAASAKELPGNLHNWVHADHSVQDIINHMRAMDAKRNSRYNPPDEYYRGKAADARAALEDIKNNPQLMPHVEEQLRIDRKMFGNDNLFDPMNYMKDAVRRATIKVNAKEHTTQDGTKLSVNVNDTHSGLPARSGLRRDSYNGSVRVHVNGRQHWLPVPKDLSKLTKDHIGKFIKGTSDEAQTFIQHAVQRKEGDFSYDDSNRAKPTEKYEHFPAVPEKNKAAYMDKARSDMLAHGVKSVIYTGSGTTEERAHAAQIMASGMRALHHLGGDGLPPVELHIGGAKGTTLAFYSPNSRSITIDPKKGRYSFVHEYGHFLDDAFHGFGWKHQNDAGRYHESSPLRKVADALRETQAAKDKEAEHDEMYKSGNAKFKKYYRQDTERFARFFAQWVPHEAKKQGIELPEGLHNPYEISGNYGEKYTAEDLDRIGDMLKTELKAKKLWKGFEAFLDTFRTTRLVIRA